MEVIRSQPEPAGEKITWLLKLIQSDWTEKREKFGFDVVQYLSEVWTLHDCDMHTTRGLELCEEPAWRDQGINRITLVIRHVKDKYWKEAVYPALMRYLDNQTIINVRATKAIVNPPLGNDAVVLHIDPWAPDYYVSHKNFNDVLLEYKQEGKPDKYVLYTYDEDIIRKYGREEDQICNVRE
jgi:hypothetical protein